MPRDIPVGNGSLLVAFDEFYQIRDIYFPHVGKENHSEGHPFRLGIWIDDSFSWINEDEWKRELLYLEETLVTDVRLTNEKLKVEIISNDTVDSLENIFLRRLQIKNLSSKKREFRIFFHQDFYISESEVGDTAFYDPETLSIIHYKGKRYFLINTNNGVETFATGRKAFQGQEGTWRDAEDGKLAEGAITEGSVDSTIGKTFVIDANDTVEMFYWIAAGKTYEEVCELNSLVNQFGANALIERTKDYWHAWVNKNETDFGNLPREVIKLFKRSLLIVRTQIDSRGAIIAANDSDVTLRATDHYSYLWPRDGALVAYALDLAGYSNLTRAFFYFCSEIIRDEGYFMQKYNPDGSLASGWHASWDTYLKKKILPIQEDETALVLWALWNHYDEFRDIEFARKLYRRLIVNAGDFLVSFRDEKTKLPLSAWNLWEDRRGIHTFTCSTVIGGLHAAANFAKLFGDTVLASKYSNAEYEIRDAMIKHLYSEKLDHFVRALMPISENVYELDETVDASLFGLFYFNVFDSDDLMVKNTMKAVEEKLWANTKIGGVARYENDGYMRVTNETSGNPWFICTLWLADYRIASAKNLEDLEKAVEIFEWVVERALPSGVLAEQVDPLTGAPVSVSPLTWSHSTVIASVMNYLRKLETLVDCESCNRPLFRYDRRARRGSKRT